MAQSFTLAKEITPGLRQGEVSWGDLNNDGKLDFIQTGNTIDANAVTRVYLNKTAGFALFATGLPNIYEGRSDWGDGRVEEGMIAEAISAGPYRTVS